MRVTTFLPAVNCQSLNAITNSDIPSVSGRMYDDSPVTGSCNLGYQLLDGSTDITVSCNTDGSWPSVTCLG